MLMPPSIAALSFANSIWPVVVQDNSVFDPKNPKAQSYSASPSLSL
jgi:hypothetical protein